MLLFQCQSFIFVLELPRAYWAWDLMTDTPILTSCDKRTDKTVEQKTSGTWRGGRLTLLGGSWLPLRLPFCRIQHRHKNRQVKTAADSDSSNTYAKQHPESLLYILHPSTGDCWERFLFKSKRYQLQFHSTSYSFSSKPHLEQFHQQLWGRLIFRNLPMRSWPTVLWLNGLLRWDTKVIHRVNQCPNNQRAITLSSNKVTWCSSVTEFDWGTFVIVMAKTCLCKAKNQSVRSGESRCGWRSLSIGRTRVSLELKTQSRWINIDVHRAW